MYGLKRRVITDDSHVIDIGHVYCFQVLGGNYSSDADHGQDGDEAGNSSRLLDNLSLIRFGILSMT